jgi:hypothetical protein
MAASSAAWRPPALERVEGWQAHVDSILVKVLTNRGCRIPQVPGVSKRHDVIQVEFAKSGQHDWTFVCVQRKHFDYFRLLGLGGAESGSICTAQ